MYFNKSIFWLSVCILSAGVIFAVALTRSSTDSFSGYASVYNDKITASGEPFNEEALTAAHKTLPFGTRVKITRNDRSVVVIINDRGPFKHGRVIDLSPAAAKALGIDGVEHVEAQVQ